MPELAAKSPSSGRSRMNLLASAAGVVLAIALTAGEASALPTQSGALTGATVQAPAAGATTETITVSQSRAYAEWSSFKVNSGETFQVSGQTGKNWILVNKVTGGAGSAISGSVTANGQVWIIDPNGVTVNAGATLNVGGLLLSSAAWSSTDTTNFLAGGTSWSLTGASGPIVMNGTINASGGVVVLHAPSVTVGGAMTDAANSQFLAVAAKDVSLTFGDNGTYFTLDGVTIQRGSNGGQLQIASGASIHADRIVLAAAGESSAADIVVAGDVSATRARGDGTDIVLLAADGTGPDATPTAQTVLSGGAVPSWSAGAAGSQGTVGLSTPGSLSAAGVSIAAGGDITLAGDITATSQASLYSSTGGVSQTAGVVSTPTLTGSAGAGLSMPEANLVGAASFTAGGLAFSNAQGLTVSGVSAGSGNVSLTTTTGGLTLTGNLTGGSIDLASAGTISQTAGVITAASLTGSSVGSATLNGANLITSLGGFTASGAGAAFALTDAQALSAGGPVAAGGDLTLKTTTGGLALGGNLTGGAVDLVSAGTISQTAGVITAASLTGSSVGSATLNGANLITSLGGFTTSGAGAAFALTNAQALSAGGPVAAGGDLTLKTTTGGLTLGGNLTGGAVDLVSAGTISQTAGVITAASLTGSSVGTTTLNGANQITSLGGFTTSGAGFSLTNARALSVAGPATAGGDLTLTTTAGGLTLAGNLTATASTVDLVSAGAISQTAGVISAGSLTGSSVGSTTLNGSNLITSLGGFTSSGADFSLTNAQALSVAGPVSAGGDLTLSTTTGGLTLAGNLTATASAVDLVSAGAISQTAGVVTATSLTGSSVGSTTLNGSNLVGALATFSAGGGLSLTNAQDLSLSGVSGGTGDVVVTTSSSPVHIDGNVTAGGTITFSQAAELGADATLSASLIKFGSTLDGAHALTIAGNAEFDAVVGGGTGLASLSVSGTTALAGGAVTTTGGQTYWGASTLQGSDARLTGSLVRFGSTLDGAHGLTIVGGGEFDGAAGGTTPLTSVSVSRTTVLDGGAATTTGTQTYTGAVTLLKDATLNGSAISFGSTVDGGFNLTVDTAGTTTFTGAVGATAALGSLTTEGGGAVDVNGGLVMTTGAQSFGGPVTLGADTTFSSTGGQAIGFASTLDGAFNLVINTVGATTFAGAVGGAAALDSLTTEGGGAVDVNGGVVKTTGGQSLGGPVTLGGDTIFFSTGGQAVSFGSTLDGGFNLVLDTAGTTTFGGAVGGSGALASVTTEGGGATELSGGLIKTTGAQSFGGAVTLGADATLASTGGGDIGFASTVDGGFGLAVETTGTTRFTGAVGAGAPLGSLQVSAGSISLSGSVQTSGALSLTSAGGLDISTRLASSGGDVTLSAQGGGLALAADVGAGEGTLTLSAAGAVSQAGGTITAADLAGSSIGATTLNGANRIGTLGSFTASGAGAQFSLTDAQALSVSGPVTVSAGAGGSLVLTTSTGGLTLGGSLTARAGEGGAGGVVSLQSAGAIAQTGGVITAATLTGSAGTSASFGQANAVGTLSGFTAPGGVLFQNGAGFTATGVDGGTSTSLTASSGDLTLAGNISGGTTTLTASAGAIIQNSGVITADSLGGLAGASVLLADANGVGALSGFTARTGLSFVGRTGFTVQGVDGGTSTSLTANAGDLTLAGNVSGQTTALTASGAIAQTGGVVTAGVLTGSAGTNASLVDANAIGTLSGFSAPRGIVVVNGSGLTAAGVDGGVSTSLTANTGDLTLAGNISGTTTSLAALTGSITQTGGILSAATLTGSAGAGATLTQANAVQSLSGFTATTGLAFTAASGFSAADVDGGASTGLTAGAGPLTLSGDIGGTSVALTAAGGPIVQTGGTLTAGMLTGSSLGATTLTSANRIAALGAFTTYGPGADFTLVNAQTLTVTGPLTAGAPAPGGASGAAEGNISLTTTAGQLNLDGNLVAVPDASGAGGTVALASAGGIASGDPPGIAAQDISISSLSGSVSLGDLAATRDIVVSSATGSVSIDAASAGGNIVLRAPGDITVAGGLSATGAAASPGPAQTLFASDPTTLGGVAFSLAGSNVDLKAGGSISVGGTTTAATDARFQAGGSIAVADVSAGRDVFLDAAGAAPRIGPVEDASIAAGGRLGVDQAASGQPTVSTGALTAAGRDVAVLAETGDAAIGSASAGDDVSIRAAGSVTVAGGLTAGAPGGVEGTGVADQLVGASPSAPIGFAGTVYSNLGQGADVDVKAGWTLAGIQSQGASIRVSGATSAARDARFQATGAISLGAVTAGQDVLADGASVAAGALSAQGGDVALQASGALQIASASAGDAMVLSSGGVTTVSGALSAAGAGTGDGRSRAGDALAGAVLGLAPGQITGDVVIAATNVQLGSVSAAGGDVLMFARSAGGAAGATYLGGAASSDAQGGFDLDQAEIAGITARSLDIFAGLSAGASGDVSIGALNLPQSLPALRVYTGGAASRVDVYGPVTGGSGSSLVIGDTQLRSVLNPPSAAVLALSRGWTPKVIRVEGTIGGLGAGQAFDQVSLSAQSLYIAPVESGLDFEAVVQTTRPEALPVYIGSMTYQISAAHLQLSASGPGVIYQRNLALNPADLSAGVGLSVGKLTIDTPAQSDAPPSQVALFGTLSPQGTLLNGPTAALSLTFLAQSGPAAPVLFTPPSTTAALYKFSTCAFGGGACFVNAPPINVNPVPVTSQIGDVSDPYAPIDEEPVTSSGGEIAWPTSSPHGKP